MNASMYERMLNDVQIRRTPRLNNRAVQVSPEEVTAQDVQYTPDVFTKSELIKVGIGGDLFVIPANSTQRIPAPTLQNPLQPLKGTIDSTSATFLYLEQVNIAAIDLTDGDPITASVFSEVSLQSEVSWPTVQTGQNIKVSIINVDGNPHRPGFTLTGWRLRA